MDAGAFRVARVSTDMAGQHRRDAKRLAVLRFADPLSENVINVRKRVCGRAIGRPASFPSRGR